MSLSEGFSWSYGDWHFTGYSLAGITTSIFFRNAGICFDVGQGLPFQNSAKHILITHAHMDHASGIPYLLSQKNMNGQKESRILVPESFEKPIREIIRLWQQVDGHVYDFDLISAKPGLVYELDRLYSAKPFLTPHRVSSQGYIVYQKKKRLKAEYRALNEDQIRELKKKGEVPSESFLDPIVAFTGDTKKEFLQSDADISLAKVLFVEVTFWDHAKIGRAHV
mgnify:CR=1 FL=1